MLADSFLWHSMHFCAVFILCKASIFWEHLFWYRRNYSSHFYTYIIFVVLDEKFRKSNYLATLAIIYLLTKLEFTTWGYTWRCENWSKDSCVSNKFCKVVDAHFSLETWNQSKNVNSMDALLMGGWWMSLKGIFEMNSKTPFW